MQFTRRLAILLAALMCCIVAGTIGYAATEGTSIGVRGRLDARHGHDARRDPAADATPAAACSRSVLELFGIGTLFYGLATVAEFFVSGQLSGLLSARRMQRMIDSYKDHFIVCGYGRVGRQVARDLRAAGAEVVVIDPNPEHREPAAERRGRLIESSASEDDVLPARRDRARRRRDRVRRLRRREHLHRAQRPRAPCATC